MGIFTVGKVQPTRRGMLGIVAAGATLLFTTGVIGVSAAHAATNKPVVGVGVRCCKRPNGNRRIVPIPTDSVGRIVYTASEAGDYDVEVDRAGLQRAVDALAASEAAEAATAAATQRRMPGAAAAVQANPAQRLVIIRFAPGAQVTAPNGQQAVSGHPGVFILTTSSQTFIVNNVAQGAVISASIETVDASDLMPAGAATPPGAMRGAATAVSLSRSAERRLLGNYSGARIVPNAAAGARLVRR